MVESDYLFEGFWYLVLNTGPLSSADKLSLDSSAPLYSDSDLENKLTESNELSFLLKESSLDEEPAAVD